MSVAGSAGASLRPATDLQNLQLHRGATLFTAAVDRFLNGDPDVKAGGSPEPVYFKPPGKPVTSALVTETIAGQALQGAGPPMPDKPGFSMEYRTSRRRLERVKPRLCQDSRWMACIVESTGFEASEVRWAAHPLYSIYQYNFLRIERCVHPPLFIFFPNYAELVQVSLRLKRMAEILEATAKAVKQGDEEEEEEEGATPRKSSNPSKKTIAFSKSGSQVAFPIPLLSWRR